MNMNLTHRNHPNPHPICLLAGAVSLLVCLVFVHTRLGLIILTGLFLISGIVLRFQWWEIGKGLIRVWPFLFLTALVHIFLSGHESVTFETLFNFNFNANGIQLAIFFTVRLILILSAGLGLFQLYSPQHYGRAIGVWLTRLSFGRATCTQIELIITLALRFVPFLEQEFERLKMALSARGINRKSSLHSRLYYFRTILFTLILNAFRRAEHVALALEARGYSPQIRRSSLNSVAIKPVELLVTLIFIGVCIISPMI